MIKNKDSKAIDDNILEVLPLNSEQRDAIRLSLNERLTVITGPPGTGKSQIVVNLLINAMYRNMKVIFASRNNKAVDVVSTRMNEITSSYPSLLRIGSKSEYIGKLKDYLGSLMVTGCNSDYKNEMLKYDDMVKKYEDIYKKINLLDNKLENLIKIKSFLDEYDQKINSYDIFNNSNLSKNDWNDLNLDNLINNKNKLNNILNDINNDYIDKFYNIFWIFVKNESLMTSAVKMNEFICNLFDIFHIKEYANSRYYKDINNYKNFNAFLNKHIEELENIRILI